jgi:hypothetical protein
VNLSAPKLLDLLRQMTRKAHECELTASLTGENFNLFNILGLSTAEVRTHSKFIAELLDPQGSHGQGAVYLDLFLKRSDIGPDKFNPKRASVVVEQGIGLVDNVKCTGGRIDIMLTDHNRRILIENKIHAGDLDKQLLRYHNFDKNAVLVYLTLDGKAPDETSTGGKKFDYIRLSYGKQILQWLDDCHRASVSLPVVRESIVQYKHLICELTHQATGDKVKDEAKKLILDHPEHADAAVLLGDAWKSVLSDLKIAFYNKVKRKDSVLLDNGVRLIIGMPDDLGGITIAFHAEKGDKTSISCEEKEAYAQALKQIEPTAQSNSFWNVGWFNPKPFGVGGGFESFPPQDIVSLFRDTTELELRKIVDDVGAQAECVKNDLIKQISSKP